MHTSPTPWAAIAPLFVVIGTSLTARVCHGTNVLQLGARKAARVDAELRASKIGRFDGMELAHDDPDAPGIITDRPAVGEIWSIDGAPTARRHISRQRSTIKDFLSKTSDSRYSPPFFGVSTGTCLLYGVGNAVSTALRKCLRLKKLVT